MKFRSWVVAVALLCLCRHAQAATWYTVTALSFNADKTSARDINDEGQVVGSRRDNSDKHAVLWTGSSPQDLGTLGGSLSIANSINSSGQIVGQSYYISNRQHAFRWDNGTMSDLGALPGDDQSFAYDINDIGEIVGVSFSTGTPGEGFLWRDNSMIALDDRVTNIKINNSGRIAYTTQSSVGRSEAHMWEDGQTTLLPTLGGLHANIYGINNLGWVVGASNLVSGGFNACLWQNGQAIDLGGMASYAFGVNDVGQIVGQQGFDAWETQAVLWEDGQLIDLNDRISPTSGWVLNGANAINNSGQIVGFGHVNGQGRAFLLTPIVPEPSSFLALLTGAGGMGLLLRRRK